MAMPSRYLLILVLILFYFPFVASAEKIQFDVNASFIFLDAGSDDNFDSGESLTFFFDYNVKDWLALEAGFLMTTKAQDDLRTDIVGTYQASIETQSILLGIKPLHRFDGPFEVYGRLGLLYWNTELEVEEYFGIGKPGGTTTADDQGYGYYLNIGGAHNITKKLIVQLEISHMKQSDVFKGQSSNPFDLIINSFGIGLGYRF